MRKTINIGDLGTIITGKTPPTTNKNYYGDYAVFIKPTDISEQSKYTYETEEMYSKLAAEKYESSLIPKGAICVPCIGTIGTKMTMAPCDCYTNQSINSIICNENYDNEYVYYLIKNFLPGLKAYNLGTASGREYVSKSNFEKIELVAEQDKEIQKKIGVILSRYDSLIENYQKQIKLLEEAAQRLYKEWFVDLRFPGHENTKIVDGVPEGWEKKKVNSIIELQSGFAFKSSTFDDNGAYKIVTIKNVKDGAFDGDNVSRIVAIPEKMPKHCVLADGDILLSLTGNVGRVCIVNGKNYLLNQRVAKLATDYKAFAYCLFRSRNMFIEVNNLANGAAQQNVSPIRIGEMKILLPNNELLQEFESIARKSIARIISLQSQLRLLTEARDRLLPKLMSGELTLEARAEKEDLLATPCKRGWEEDEAK